MRIIIFEGADKVGKTTTISKLLNSLKEEGFKTLLLNLPFEYSESLTKEERNYRLRVTVNLLLDMSEHFDDNYICIIDRLHISEKVFGNVLRGEYDERLFNTIDILVAGLNALLITVEPDSIQENFLKFKDEENLLDGLTHEQYSEIVNLFNDSSNDSRIKNKYKTKTKYLSNIKPEIIKRLEEGVKDDKDNS
jgi:thymidylate kinase